MTLVSLIDCSHLLAIDLKTLHRWMTHARLSAQSHPLDARLKCLTPVQIQQLATTHRRVLPDLEELCGPSQATITSMVEMSASPVPDLSLQVPDLTRQLSTLQAQVAMLQHQLTLLTEQLQKEQEWRISQSRAFQEKSRESSRKNSPESSPENSPESSPENSPESSRKKTLAAQSKPSHVLPLVEYGGVQGKYVVVSPKQGMLAFEPDSPEWFAWLSTLSSFRFVGALGHFTARRGKEGPPGRSWRASRHIRNRCYDHSLGKTEALTVANLEQVAAALQSHLN